MSECKRCGAFVLPEPATAEQQRAEYAALKAREDEIAELRARAILLDKLLAAQHDHGTTNVCVACFAREANLQFALNMERMRLGLPPARKAP